MKTRSVKLVSPVSLIVAALVLLAIFFIASGIESPRGNFGHSPPIWVGLKINHPDVIYAALETYGREGREAIKTILMLDAVYAAAWSLLLGCIIVLSGRYLFTNRKKLLQFFTLFPIIGFALDELQNITIAVILYQFPVRLEGLALASSYLSVGLWFFIYVSIALAAVGTISAGVLALMRRAKTR